MTAPAELSSVASATTLTGLGEVRRAAPPSGEALLIARAAAGEGAAQKEIYERHVDAVYRRLTHLLGPDPEREDLVQQIFSEVFRRLQVFRGEARLSTFLYRVASNVACDHLKRRRRRREACDCELLAAQPSGEPSPEAVLSRRQELERLARHLDRLKPKKRIAYLLRVVEGLSLDEIAEQVGARRDAVAQRILHAQRELLAMFEREEKRGLR